MRLAFDMGARYMTITHNCDNAWATAASTVTEGGEDKGLTEFGPELIKEMNRLGMLVDLSHVSHQTMRDILEITDVPVMFSHSSAYAVSKHNRNVPDDVLRTVKKNNGVVMVTFVNSFLNVTDPDSVDVNTAVEHIYHIAQVAGWDHVGIGGDYDGTDALPKGLEVSTLPNPTGSIQKTNEIRCTNWTGKQDVSKYPNLIKHVLDRGATDEQVRKLIGKNVLRVWTEVERRGKQIRRSGALPTEEVWSGRNWTEFPLNKRNQFDSGRHVQLPRYGCD